MIDDARTFHALRPRLQKIAYRMLGSIADAEDIVQDVWLRWHDAARDGIENAEAWLVAVTTRTSIDRLRAAKIRREHYTGIWLPEPELGESPATPEEMTERANDVSVAYLLLLERLTPEARAAFLLREVFDADYDEIADAIGKSEAACRQLVSRAKAQLRDDDRPRHIVPRETHRQLLQTFSHALAQGDFPSIQALLAEDAMLIGDGGGKVQSFPKPMVGGRRIAQLFYATWLRCGSGVEMRPVVLNGEWAMLRIIAGQLESAMAFETDGTRIVRILVQRNPDKLARIAAACSAG
ncbi:RNA polymerase sigma-70 factor [Burkholderia cenocepacia]|nr:RNA polymerase sigma-70 factor [Burkholderia cenocepacia]RQV22304.1 RNA polymerase sigma-70 factor [Burkholderia cenocepacia]RQV72708.1 RNA polymerase sigma-70 factor [Burkholderia cenocepacia]